MNKRMVSIKIFVLVLELMFCFVVIFWCESFCDFLFTSGSHHLVQVNLLSDFLFLFYHTFLRMFNLFPYLIG